MPKHAKNQPMPKLVKNMPLKPLDRLLVTLEEAASLCACGVKQWKELVATRRAPQPVRLFENSHPKWSRMELEEWAAKGFPQL